MDLSKLAALPIFGALFKGRDGGLATSEFGVVAALTPTILAVDAPGWAKVFALAILGVGYAWSRGSAKTTGEVGALVEVPAAPPAASAAAKAGALLLAVAVLGGCASTERAAYRAAIGGMTSTADAVDPPDGSAGLVKSPLSPGEAALLDAWRFQRKKARDLLAADGER